MRRRRRLKKEWGLDVETFTITGASKRGWTTWLTGAVDDRAVAIAPMVIDMLNMSQHTKLQRASFGGKSSEQIDDYEGLDEQIDTPRGVALRKIVDPWEYRERLTQPKLVILGTNDRYWPLDACNLYWNDLAGREVSDLRAQQRPRPARPLADRRRAERHSTAASSPASRCRSSSGGSRMAMDVVSAQGRERRAAQPRAGLDGEGGKTRDFRDSQVDRDGRGSQADAAFVFDQLPRPADGYSRRCSAKPSFTKGRTMSSR